MPTAETIATDPAAAEKQFAAVKQARDDATARAVAAENLVSQLEGQNAALVQANDVLRAQNAELVAANAGLAKYIGELEASQPEVIAKRRADEQARAALIAGLSADQKRLLGVA